MSGRRPLSSHTLPSSSRAPLHQLSAALCASKLNPKRELPAATPFSSWPRGDETAGPAALSRVADSSASPAEERRGGVDKAPRAGAAAMPEGHVPVHVGEGPDGEAERFLVRAELLGRPALAHLLGRAAQEYGYAHQGPLRIPCSPAAFRRALATLDEP